MITEEGSAGKVFPIETKLVKVLPLGIRQNSLEQLHIELHWVLRVTVAFCFMGHGAWGLLTKESWLPFFYLVNIPETLAWKLMPIVGSLDIVLGFSLLIFGPRRVILSWMFFWTVWTAVLRPLVGLEVWEFLERAGNYAPPLAMLVLGGAMGQTPRSWFGPMVEPDLTPKRLDQIRLILRLGLGMLLIGHGAFGVFMQKSLLSVHLASIGIVANGDFLRYFGSFELFLGILVMWRPTRFLLLWVLLWKVATELLYPISGSWMDIFEFIERSGDYGIPVCLILIETTRLKNIVAEGRSRSNGANSNDFRLKGRSGASEIDLTIVDSRG